MAEESQRTRKGTDRPATKRPAEKTVPAGTPSAPAGDRSDERVTSREHEVRSPAGTTTAREPLTTADRGTFGAIAHAILRIGAGLLFMQHGVQKLFGWLGGFGGEPGATAELFSLMGLAGVLETFGGLLIVLGLLARPVAAILVVEMVVAYFMAHAPQGGFPIQNGGEPAVLFALIFLFIAATGPGPASLDRAIRRGRTRT